MRNRFSDLVKDGVASFKYTALTSDTPDTDPISISYNNIFSIPTDTHMSITDDGNRVITGHMINTEKWDEFICSPYWGAVVFKTTGYWSLGDFLNKNGLKGSKTTLNGDVVYLVQYCEEGEDCGSCPACCYTHESKIPQSLYLITNELIKLQECYKDSKNLKEVAQKMNESLYINGTDWMGYNGKIYGLVNNKVIIL